MVDTDGTFLGTGSSSIVPCLSVEELNPWVKRERSQTQSLTREERGTPQLPPSTRDGQKGHFLLGEDTAGTQS